MPANLGWMQITSAPIVRATRRRRLLAHLYGPAARLQAESADLERLVLRFCIRPIDGAFERLAIMDIRARSISFASRPRRPDGPPDHERAGETFSISSFQLADLGGKADYYLRDQPKPWQPAPW